MACAAVERVAPGDEAVGARRGDLILTHGRAWTSRLIRFGQGLRFRGADRPFAHWNHTAILVDEGRTIVEALGAGVTERPLSAYRPTEYHLVRLIASDQDREQAAAFARWALGQRYGFATIASITFGLLTGASFTFGFQGQHICSGLVARALERTGAIFDRSPSHVMPADLARYFRVPAPAEGMPIGEPPPVG